MATELIEIRGHIVDSLTLPRILDAIVEAGADYEMIDIEIGRTNLDESHARLEVTATGSEVLDALLEELQVHGANIVSHDDAESVSCDLPGVLPAGFYSTTNLPTEVRVGGTWREVDNPEMDCAIVIATDSVRTVPMHRVLEGERVVVGRGGVRVRSAARLVGAKPFEFMSSEASSEKPKLLQVRTVADRMRAARADGRRILVVAGPVVVHTGGAPSLARLVRDRWVDVLFSGNGFATHDIEANTMGTSLGVSMEQGTATEGGHSNHLRVINEVRRHGSITAATAAGFITGGVMYECVERGVPFVLAGSIRDDGPLPDTMSDTVAAADAMRGQLHDVGVALILATTLHGIATGNILPAGVETFCVDINQAVVTKLADRGSHQALGIVTDVGPFLHELAAEVEAT